MKAIQPLEDRIPLQFWLLYKMEALAFGITPSAAAVNKKMAANVTTDSKLHFQNTLLLFWFTAEIKIKAPLFPHYQGSG